MSRRLAALSCVVLALTVFAAWAQGTVYKERQVLTVGTALPSLPCHTSDLFMLDAGGASGVYVCLSNAWTSLATAGVPSGSILFIASGSCPTGYTEETALNGKTLIGTLAANGNIGSTGGADNITPAGTNGTGTVTPSGTIAWPAGVPTYAGAVGTLAVTAHTVVATKQGTAAGNVVTTATHAIAGVPGGTVTWPAGVPTLSGGSNTTSAQTFTGTAHDNRSAFVRLIGCRKT